MCDKKRYKKQAFHSNEIFYSRKMLFAALDNVVIFAKINKLY